MLGLLRQAVRRPQLAVGVASKHAAGATLARSTATPIAQTAKQGTTTLRIAARGQRNPFISTHILWRYLPKEWSFMRDKWFQFWMQIQFAVVCGGVFMWTIHVPYKGDDYHMQWKSPLYLWSLSRAEADGSARENHKYKRTTYYKEDEMEETDVGR